MGIIDKLNKFATKESKLDKKPLFFLELATVIILLAGCLILVKWYTSTNPKNAEPSTEIVSTQLPEETTAIENE